MEPILAAALVIVAAVLVMSALEKLRSPAPFQRVLSGLGLRRGRLWWAVVCAGELAVVVALVAPAPAPVAAAAVAALGLIFAAAGLRALQLGKRIKCACFGQPGDRDLGWPQVAALPLWLVAAGAVYGWTPATADQRAAVVAAVIGLVLGWQSYRLLRATLASREDRRATVSPVVTRPYPLPGDADPDGADPGHVEHADQRGQLAVGG